MRSGLTFNNNSNNKKLKIIIGISAFKTFLGNDNFPRLRHTTAVVIMGILRLYSRFLFSGNNYYYDYLSSLKYLKHRSDAIWLCLWRDEISTPFTVFPNSLHQTNCIHYIVLYKYNALPIRDEIIFDHSDLSGSFLYSYTI